MKTQNKIIAGILATSLIGISSLSFVNAANTGTTSTGATKTQIQAIFAKQKAGTTLTDAENTLLSTAKNMFGQGHKGEKGRHGGGDMFGPMQDLTDTEKTALTSMTDTQKQAFFDKKRTEQEAKMEANESVIDKVLNGEVLTDAEKVTLETVKKERAARKLERQTRKAEMTTMKPILDKKRAGTTLTADEQSKLDTFEASHPHGGKGGHKGPDADGDNNSQK